MLKRNERDRWGKRGKNDIRRRKYLEFLHCKNVTRHNASFHCRWYKKIYKKNTTINERFFFVDDLGDKMILINSRGISFK